MEEEKAVSNVASKLNAIEPNVLEWAAHSNSRNIKLLIAEMRSKPLEEPSKKAGREKYSIYLRPDDFTSTVSGRVLVVICLIQACIAMRINTCNTVYTQWRSQGHCFGGQVASGEGILGGSAPQFLHGIILFEWS